MEPQAKFTLASCEKVKSWPRLVFTTTPFAVALTPLSLVVDVPLFVRWVFSIFVSTVETPENAVF
jgi:hypothetical protein